MALRPPAVEFLRRLAGRIMASARSFGSAAADLLYPPACPGCGRGLARHGGICEECLSRCVRISRPFCERCSLPFEGLIPRPFKCPNCAGRVLEFGVAVAPWRSRGPVREMIHGFKYHRRIGLADIFLPWLREALLDDRLANLLEPGEAGPLVVPVPLHHVRYRERGYNQAALLAERLARAEGWECAAALRRIRYTTTQTALDRAQRAANLSGAFAPAPRVNVDGRRVLLVDDVLTTCATVSECAAILLREGARSVDALAIARA